MPHSTALCTFEYVYVYIYTADPVYEVIFSSQTRQFRKPDMCPVSEEKCRKPVLVGLRSNKEMNIFGFRRCYGKKIKMLIIVAKVY